MAELARNRLKFEFQPPPSLRESPRHQLSERIGLKATLPASLKRQQAQKILLPSRLMKYAG